MALTLNEAVKIVGDGSAEDYLQRFIEKTLEARHAALIDGAALTPESDDAFIAAQCLALVLDEPGVRQVLNLKRLPRGRAFDPWELAARSGMRAMHTAMRYRLGLIDQPAALNELANACEDVYGKQPKDDKTLASMLQELIGEADAAIERSGRDALIEIEEAMKMWGGKNGQ